MATAVQTAEARWEGPLASGTGTVRMGSRATGQASDLCLVSRLFAWAKAAVDAVLAAAQ